MAKTTAEQKAILVARIAADTAKLAELNQAEAAGDAVKNLKPSDSIQFVYGRGENRKQHTGQVLAITEGDKGKRIRVQFGEGMEADVATISQGDVISVGEVPAAEAASSDPLASIQ